MKAAKKTVIVLELTDYEAAWLFSQVSKKLRGETALAKSIKVTIYNALMPLKPFIVI